MVSIMILFVNGFACLTAQEVCGAASFTASDTNPMFDVPVLIK
jgi:hypothetical protein